jgi:acetyltransferase-like isoleucine patch superfamily enzyme
MSSSEQSRIANPTGISGAEIWRAWYYRRLQLLRGQALKWRGARVGLRFGLGRNVRVEFPGCFVAGDDVTIEEYGFLHCLSGRGVWIGNHTSIDRNAWLHCGGTLQDHDHGYVEIGDYSFVGCNAVLGAGGGIRIGNHVLIGQGVNIHAENHCFSDPSRLIRQQGVSYQGVVIEDDVWIGAKATILDGVTIGRGAIVGAGAVVTEPVPASSIVMGVPARAVGLRGEDSRENCCLP